MNTTYKSCALLCKLKNQVFNTCMHNNDHYYINRQCVNSIKIFEDVDNQYAQPDVLHELKTPLRQTKSTEKKSVLFLIVTWQKQSF